MIISTVICRVVSSKNKKGKAWKVVEHPEKDLIGETVACGLPNLTNLPIGSEYKTTLTVP